MALSLGWPATALGNPASRTRHEDASLGSTWARLPAPFQPRSRSASLLEEPSILPASLAVAMAGELHARLAADAAAFARELASREGFAGSGDGVEPQADPVLAFALGLLVGFGMGHFFVARNVNRGLVWMGVDAGILTLMVLFFALAGPVGAIFLVALVIERVVQGLDAMAGLGKTTFPFGEGGTLDPAHRLAGTPVPFTPNLFSLRF
ncbi:MAG TPA: hypothetical protein VMB50_20145 [Myxococcales bacterium]|nr:hypothetical protein [Myxococcales bacterium]